MENINYTELFKQDLESKYQVLEHREQLVLHLRYIDNLTYKQIGKYINRCSETVRRIQLVAERKFMLYMLRRCPNIRTIEMDIHFNI